MIVDSALLQQGLELMVFGMGSVFLFLSLLVLGMMAMSAILARLPGGVGLEPANPVPGHELSDTQVAAITGAIHRYRRGHRRGCSAGEQRKIEEESADV